jgi:plastocyanin
MSNSVVRCNGQAPLTLRTRSRAIRVALFCVAAASLASLALSGLASRTADASAPATVVIKMLDMPPSFAPAQVTIKAGDTVKWENVGNSVHHATDDPAAAIKPGDVANPAGAKPFDSGFLPPGSSFTYTFTVPGTYKYVCAAHETSGMSGEVVVR